MRPAAEVVGAARAFIGTPYRHQAARIGAGCDCLGLVRGVWQALYGEALEVPLYGADWRRQDEGADLLTAARERLAAADGPPMAGQVALFRLRADLRPRHCGIVISPTRFIHAQEQLGVVEASFSPNWQRRLAGLFTFP